MASSYTGSCVDTTVYVNYEVVEDDVGGVDKHVPDWENIDDIECEESILASLKKLGNIKRQMSPLILKDMLSSDADVAVKDIKSLTIKCCVTIE